MAGYVHAGESYQAAAVRRLREELALSTPLSRLGAVRMSEDGGATKFIDLYETRAERPAIHIQDPQHIESVRFWRVHDIHRRLSAEPQAFTETFPYVLALFDATRM